MGLYDNCNNIRHVRVNVIFIEKQYEALEL